MKRLVWGWAAVLAVSAWTLFALGAGAADAQDFAYVANAASNSVSVLDTASNTVVTTVGVGSRPFGVAITPDGTRAYVTNGDPTVSVLDTTVNKVVAAAGVGDFPRGVAIIPAGSPASVANNKSH